MNKKRFTIFFIVEYILLFISAGILWWYGKQIEPYFETEDLGTAFLYFYSIVCAVSTIVAVFLALGLGTGSPVLKLTVLTCPAILVLIDWLLYRDHNMIFCLPVLIVASFMLLKKVHDS